MFVITACPTHGTKVTADLASFVNYAFLARACADDAHTNPADHAAWHEHDDTDCWECCSSMVIDPYDVCVGLSSM